MSNNISREFVQNHLVDFALGDVDESTGQLIESGLNAYPELREELAELKTLQDVRVNDVDAYREHMSRKSINIQPKVLSNANSKRAVFGQIAWLGGLAAVLVIVGAASLFLLNVDETVQMANTPQGVELVSEADLLAVLAPEEVEAITIDLNDISGTVETQFVSDEAEMVFDEELRIDDLVEVVSSAIFDDQLQIEEMFASVDSDQEINELIALLEQEL